MFIFLVRIVHGGIEWMNDLGLSFRCNNIFMKRPVYHIKYILYRESHIGDSLYESLKDSLRIYEEVP